MVVLTPSLITMLLNARIFIYSRSISNRVRHHNGMNSVTENTIEAINNRPPGMSKRDLHLLRQIFMMSSIFIFGWGPGYIAAIFGSFTYVSPIISPILVLIGTTAALSYTLILFFYDHEMRQFLRETLQNFRCQ